MDWSPLASDDPLRGDPAGIESSSRRFAGLADALFEEAGRIGTLDPGAAWVGLAAVRFAEARDQLPRQVRAAARRFELTSDALAAWSTEVAAAQAAGLAARDRAREAEADMAAARTGIYAMQWHARQAALDASTWNAAHPDGPHRSPAPWRGPDWPARLEDAELRLVRARRDFAEAIRDHREGAARARRRLDEADAVLDDPAWVVGGLGAFLRRVLAGPGELPFIVTPDGLQLNTSEAWRWETYRQAGIDPAAWVPDRGLAPLDGTAVAAWEFYAELYERRPDEFLWSGMATLAGGTFYAAFQDVHVLRNLAEQGDSGVDAYEDAVRALFPGLPDPAYDHLMPSGARSIDGIAADLRYVEVTFLEMQKQIFDDLAWQHVAYDQGGLAAMEGLHATGDIKRVHIEAWRDIASGDPDRIAEGNRDLLEHEQREIIGREYDQIRSHSTFTWTMTMGMSVLAESPVPGGRPFREVVPYEVVLDTPDRIPVIPDPLIPDRIPFTDVRIPGGGGLHIDTPDQVHVVDLPIHNVSIFDNRWRWIEGDMLPAWLDHVDGGTAGSLVAEPIADQAARQVLIADWPVIGYDPE